MPQTIKTIEHRVTRKEISQDDDGLVGQFIILRKVQNRYILFFLILPLTTLSRVIVRFLSRGARARWKNLNPKYKIKF